MTDTQKEIILAEGTPNDGATKKTQILLRRKMISQWENYDQVIPIGEPCFAYDGGELILKIGAPNEFGEPQLWNALELLIGRVDDGELT